ncbi:MFS transporter [Phenylobacterium sp.]|uniref:MFS transporter n=1 Tax=Phenylobacterium sp. TaxID=1871053 RepID=UPI002623F8B7|nr:MFS transporter [Phenylobacterium sp.]
MKPRPLWRERDFRRLWIAQSVSDFGARITREGLPMMAVLGLAASPAQLGLLAALASGPTLIAGLAAGGLVDARRRRPLLVAADLVRAAVLVTIPLAAWMHALTIWQVYAAAALVAGASAVFDIADHAYLPTLVERARLTEANSRMAATESLAEMGGPALAGALFQWLTAPFAVAVNAATYLASAVFLARIEAPEPAPEPERRRRRRLEGLRTGLATAWEHPVVRPMLVTAAVSGLFGGVFSATYMIFALNTLGLRPALLGLIIACGGAASLAGSAIARPLSERIGIGPAIIASGLIAGASSLLAPLAGLAGALSAASLIGAQLLGDSFGVAVIILAVSLRQSLIAPERLGRTGAAFQAMAGGGALIGALGGGWVAQTIGVQAALFIAAAGLALAPLIGLVSPLRDFRKIPAASA